MKSRIAVNFRYRLSLVSFAVGAVLPVVMAGDLPSGVPNPIGPDGKYTHAMFFTTKAYQDEAFRLVLREANEVAKELQLPEELPITESNLVKAYINPFGYAYAKKAIGNVTTKNYVYYVSQGNRFSYLESPHQDQLCRKFQASYTWPISRVDTNQAYQLATQWLAAASMDVGALNQECTLQIDLEDAYVHPPADRFVPIYNVCWSRKHVAGGVASVRLFTPAKILLQLRVEDPKYILRQPLIFTNLPFLLSQTNAPVAAATPIRQRVTH